MKIGFVLDDSLDRPDGVQQYVVTVGEWMRRKGHEVHYLTGETRRTDLENIHCLARNIDVRFNQNRLSIPFTARGREIKKLMNELKLDILHIQLPFSPFLAGKIIKAAQNEAILGTFHVLPSSLIVRVGTRILGFIQRRSLDKFNSIFAPSIPARQFALKSYGVAAQVLPNPVDLSRFKDSVTKNNYNHKTIVFLGRLVERKGCMRLLKAINALQTKNSLINTKVLIGGKGPLEKDLRQYVERQGLGGIVKFCGFVNEADKAKFLAEADVAVFPSTGGESFGIVLIEAMAAGASVVIGGDNAGYRSVLGASDFVFDPNNTEDFARKLQLLLDDDGLRRRLHKVQQANVKKYDIDLIGQHILESYETAIANSSQRSNN